MTALSATARDQIRDQYAQLAARVEQSRMYMHEVTEFPVAIEAYEWALEHLQAADLEQSLTTPESRNLVRKVGLPDGTLGVLKVIGNTREPGEGNVLEVWNAQGVPSVRVIDHGYRRVEGQGGKGRSAIWLLTEFDPSPTLGDSSGWSVGQKAAVVRDLTGFLTEHVHGISESAIPRPRTWEQRMGLHTMWTVPLLEDYGISEPPKWRDKLSAIAEGNVLLHGDAAGSNVLVDPKTGFRLLDPPGAVVGLPESDIGQICAQVGKIEDVVAMVQVASETNRKLDPSVIALVAGLNFFTWAGYSLANHYNPDALTEIGKPSAANIEQAARFVETGKTLMAEFDLQGPVYVSRESAFAR